MAEQSSGGEGGETPSDIPQMSFEDALAELKQIVERLEKGEGRLDEVDLSWDPRVCCCVVMASGGYPGDYEKGRPITGIDDAEADPDVQVFHGTTTTRDGQLVTAGGRVLNVCALGRDLGEAQAKANAACEKIEFEGAYYRRDIGHRVLKAAGR